VVSRKPTTWLVLTLLAAVAVQTLTAAPARASAELRAVNCCAKVCHKADPFSAAKRCCQVRPVAPEVASLSSPPQHHEPTVLAAPLTAAAASAAVPDGASGRVPTPPHRAGPVFLVLRSLRI
jgi:hypothetical protein